MKEGDVVLVAIPQADGTRKNRPAIVLREMPPYQDLLVCGVSTQLREEVEDFDEVIGPQDSDFESSGLVAESLIRLGFLTVVAQNRIVGAIGQISPVRHKGLLQKLSKYLLR